MKSQHNNPTEFKKPCPLFLILTQEYIWSRQKPRGLGRYTLASFHPLSEAEPLNLISVLRIQRGGHPGTAACPTYGGKV